MKFNNLLKLCILILICLIGVIIAASSSSSTDDRKSGKGRQIQSQSSIEEGELNVDNDPQLVILRKIYIGYLLNPNDQLLVDANLISSLYHMKVTANILLHEYNGLQGEREDFLQLFAEYQNIFNYILRNVHNNEERYCALFKLVYWTLRKNNVLNNSSAWRENVREVFEEQLISEKPPMTLDWEKQYTCTEHDKRAIRHYLHKDGTGEVMNEFALRVLMHHCKQFKAFIENYASKMQLKQRLQKLMGKKLANIFVKNYGTVFGEVESNSEERLMLHYKNIILSKSTYSVKDSANTDQAAAMMHYNRRANLLLTNFKSDHSDEKIDKRLNELKILYSETKEIRQRRTNWVLCVMYKFYRQIVDDPLLLGNSKWRTYLEAEIRRYTSRWIKHPDLIKMESEFTDEEMNFDTLECSNEENEKVEKMVRQSPYREQNHFWCLQWLIKNSAEFKQFLDENMNGKDLERIKSHLYTLLGTQELDRLELINAETLKFYEPDENFLIDMYKSYIKTDKHSANIIELRLSVSYLMTNIFLFGKRISQRIMMSKENEQRFLPIFENVALYKRKIEATLPLIVGMPDAAEDTLKGMACSMMKFDAICPNIDDVDAIAVQFMKKSVNEWLKCSETELGETMSKLNDLMKSKHKAKLSIIIETNKGLRDEIRHGKFAVYRMSKLVGDWNMQWIFSMTTTDFIKDPNYFKNINDWISGQYANFFTGDNKNEKSDLLRNKILLNMFATVNYIESVKMPSNFADVVRCQMLIQIGKALLAADEELAAIEGELPLQMGGLLKHIENGLPGGKQRDLEKTYHEWKNILQSALEQKDKQKESIMMPNMVQNQHSLILLKLAQSKQRDTDSSAFNFLKFYKGLFDNKYGRDRLVDLMDVAFIRSIYDELNLQFKEDLFPKSKQIRFTLEELEKEEKSSKKTKSKKKKSKNLSKIEEEEKTSEQKSKKRSGRNRSSSTGADRSGKSSEVSPLSSPLIVDDIGSPSQFRHNINLFFNMPSTRVRNELCDKYGYRNVSNKTKYSSDFTFATDEYEPGEVVDIKGDGNCGYRSLSYILTGTQNNHVKIRKDTLEYLEKALFAGKDWCGVYGLKGLEEHIKVAREPSRGPQENDKWMSNIDILAAAKLYNMNIIVCEPNQAKYRWQIHSPSLTKNLESSEQDVNKPSVFIYHSPGHYEVIKNPQKMSQEREQSITKMREIGESANLEERGRKSPGSIRLTKSNSKKEPSIDRKEGIGDSNDEKDKSEGRKESKARSSSRDRIGTRRRSSSSKSSGREASGHSMSVERRENAAKMGKLIIEEIGKSNMKACRSKKGLFEYYGKFVGNPNEIVQQMCDFCVNINQIEKQIKQGEIILKKLGNNLCKIDQKRLDSVKIEWNEMVGRNFGPIGANPQMELKEKLHAVLRELNEILFGRKVSSAESMAVEIADILGQLHFNKFSHFLSLDKEAKSNWDSKPESFRQLALFNLIHSIGDWKASEKTLKSYKKRMDRFNERIASWKKFSEQAALAQYMVKKEDFVAKNAHNWQQIQFGTEEKTTDSKLTTQLQDEIKFVDIFGEEKEGKREIQLRIIFKNAYKSVKEIVVDWNKEAELMEYGSYMIGALTVSSDVDAICVLPEAAKLDSFFGESICNILESLDKRRRPVRTRNCDDQSLYCKFCKNDNIIKVVKIPGARIPIIKLEYCADKDAHKIFLDKCQDRVDFDLQFAAVPFAAKSNGKSKYDIDGHIRELKGKLLDSDEKQVTLRSLEGLKQNELILESLPKNTKNFRLSISAIKHWAKKYHIYSPIYGYLKGIGLTIMMAKIFALFPTATVPFLLEMFFFIFITWPWQMPVQLLPVANNTPAGPKWELEAKNLRANWYSRFGLPTNIVMPIVAPDPEEDISLNMTESGKEIVMESMQEGLRRIREVRESGGHWGRFMDGIDIGRNYQHFLVINCATRGSDEKIAEDFCEYVNSKLRMQMTLDVVNNRLNSSNIRTAHIFTTKKAQNHRCVIPGDNFAHFQGYFCKLWLVGLKYFDNAQMSEFDFSRFERKLSQEDQQLFKSYAVILLRKSQAKHQWFLDRKRDYFVHTKYLTLNQLREWGITLHGPTIKIA